MANMSDLIYDQNPTLEYGRPTPRKSLRRVTVALSIVIGAAVTLTSLCCFFAIAGTDSITSFILGLGYDKHWDLFLLPLTIVGIADGTVAWIKRKHETVSRRLERPVSWAKSKASNWSMHERFRTRRSPW